MASGDAQRVWFPEMIDDLRTYWSPTATWEDLIVFCRQMSEKRKRIRDNRGIKPPSMRCPKCGKSTQAATQDISIRSALFALKTNQIISDEEYSSLDKGWKRFQRANNLDGYGDRRNSGPPDRPDDRSCHAPR